MILWRFNDYKTQRSKVDNFLNYFIHAFVKTTEYKIRCYYFWKITIFVKYIILIFVIFGLPIVIIVGSIMFSKDLVLIIVQDHELRLQRFGLGDYQKPKLLGRGVWKIIIGLEPLIGNPWNFLWWYVFVYLFML